MNGHFPLITAHSGCEGFPDNSMQSVLAALRSGADIVEEDIRMTRDGVLVLAHDDLVKTGACEFSIAGSDYAALDGIVRLDDIVPELLHSGKKINLDLKTDDCIEAVSAFVRRHSMEDRVFLSGCGPDRATLVQRQAPELKMLLNADTQLFLNGDYPEAVRTTCEQALDRGCFGINIHYRLVSPEFILYAASIGLPVYVWTVQETGEMRRMVEWGVHSITTRHVSELVSIKTEP